MDLRGKRHIIHIEHRTSVAPSVSGANETWALFCGGLKASFWPLKGDEAIIAQQTQGTISGRFRCRYRAGVTSTMRVRCGSQIYQLVAPAINIENKNEEMELLVAEVIRG